MNLESKSQENQMKQEFMNIALALVSLALWTFIALGDLLPGSLPNLIMFDAVIMIAICGICFVIKSRSFNFACLFFVFCIALIAVQIYIASSYTPVLYLIPASLIIAVILLPLPWIALSATVNALFVLAFAPSQHAFFLLVLMTLQPVIVGTLKRYFVKELEISQGFQDYAADQMRAARESRAELVLISKQLQETQERLRVTNKKLEIAFEQAEESRQLKARFAANVSHELRTPINLIVGFSEVMILAPELYDHPLPSSYRADVHAVYRNAKHLQNLIDDVLDISQLEARHLAIVKQKASLGDCLRESANMVADLIAKKGLDFQLDIPNDLPDLWFDPVRIRQILLNLLVNATRFTSQGGITIAVSVEDGQVLTSVIDTGIGLSQDDIKRVFEEFYQVEGGAPFVDRGSGLGLTLSRELIRLHGGEMSASSAGVVGGGSRFSFSLPTTSNLVSQMPIWNGPSKATSAEKRVLVVDDDEAITTFFARYLKAHNVVACNSEAQALRNIDEFEPDVLLLARDHQYQHLEERIDALDLALDVITLPMPSGRAAIRQRGISDYLVKPVSRDMLRKVLARYGEAVRSIMIIDDNRDIARLFTRTLRSLDERYRVRAAYGGADGIAMMEREPPELLILDVLMPGMDGFAVIEAMRGVPRLCDIPIILVSAKGASESITPNIYGDITLARKGGYSPIQLVSSVQALIDGIRQPANPDLTRRQGAVTVGLNGGGKLR
ncbi:MAG: response regulator [Chloroflexota bacterium]|nr:response regulator [Chloroflexota bacterium]